MEGMTNVQEEKSSEITTEQATNNGMRVLPQIVNVEVITPHDQVLSLGAVSLLETILSVKHALSEYIETCCITNYSLVLHLDQKSVVMNEFVDFTYYLNGSVPEKVVFTMKLENYDIKTLKAHVKRTREIILFPPQTCGSTSEAGENTVVEKNDVLITSQDLLSTHHSNMREILLSQSNNSNESLDSYFHETLFQVGNCTSETNPPSSRIVCISYSGYNLPPAQRRLCGDLMYLEVVTDENTNV